MFVDLKHAVIQSKASALHKYLEKYFLLFFLWNDCRQLKNKFNGTMEVLKKDN